MSFEDKLYSPHTYTIILFDTQPQPQAYGGPNIMRRVKVAIHLKSSRFCHERKKSAILSKKLSIYS